MKSPSSILEDFNKWLGAKWESEMITREDGISSSEPVNRQQQPQNHHH